jgi:alpha-L-fucosidase
MAKKAVKTEAAVWTGRKGDTRGFVQDRFGMFIHWGLYALAARHEWVKNKECITDGQYQKYFDHFDPDLYDPRAWARMAKEAGMKYFVITTKHHEGFCLWNTEQTDYKAPNTPCGRDLLRPMVEAFRNEGIKVGFYYSLLDWHHPEYPIDKHHPQRNDPKAREAAKGRDVRKYADYMYRQVEELLTQFGKIDVIWFDFSFAGEDGKGRDDWQSERLLKMVRKHQPDIVIDDRLDLPNSGDIVTPEQFQPREWPMRDGKKAAAWEACQTFSGSWGYYRDELCWRTVDELIRTLVDCVSKGGNLLLNVGPTSRGEFDYRAVERLKGIGGWMRQHSRSIYGCTAAPADIQCPPDCRLTYNPETSRLYIHLFAWPYKNIFIDGMKDRIEYAQLLHDGSEVSLQGPEPWQLESTGGAGISKDTVIMNLPQTPPNTTVPVIELFLKK